MKNTNFTGFLWDDGNIEKCQTHGVTIVEIEYVFMHSPAVAPDISHSHEERRFQAIGKTREGRNVFVVFTFRKGAIRPISARYMHQKEVDFYEKKDSDV